MRIVYIIILLCLLYGCVSKYPLKININDYKKGLEITNSVISTDNTLNKNICVGLDSSVPFTQQLKREADGRIFYTFENRLLTEKYQSNNSCNSTNTIIVTNIKSKYAWDGMFRLNLYKTEISLESTYKCNNKIEKFTATKEKKLKKHGKLLGLGIINEKNTQALIAATVVLAFDDAISDIYNQIKSQCEI